jgi:hypothetical protein
MEKLTSPKVFWQTALVFSFVFTLTILVQSVSRWIEIGVVLYRSVWMLALLAYLAVLGTCAWLFIRIRQGKMDKWLTTLELGTVTQIEWRIVGGILFVLVLLVIPYAKTVFLIGQFVKDSTSDNILIKIVFYWTVWWLTLLAAGGLKISLRTSWTAGTAAALILMGISYELWAFARAVTTYPFSMGWSETSRYYYASLFFSEKIYNQYVSLSSLHPTRYFLQSLAFLFPGGLVWHRLWQVLLWIGTTGATVWAITRRAIPLFSDSSASLRGRGARLLFAGGLALFVLRVSIYYHLQIVMLLPLLFVSAKHPWRSLLAVIFASAWAGVSRVNWFPMAAMIAIALYLMEVPVSETKSSRMPAWITYLEQPAIWTVFGLLSALAAQAAYIPLSGNADKPEVFASSFTSDLLWYRLWPNPSYPLGIMPGILILSAPFILTLILAVKNRRALHPIRWVGLGTMLLALFVGSTIVSTKIGGGDLHNMDAFAALVSIVGAYFIGGQVRAESDAVEWDVSRWPVMALALIVMVMFLIPSLGPYPKFNTELDQSSYHELVKRVNRLGKNGPVLFINERHLVTFGDVDLPLVSDYEAVFLMEMAMSNNRTYLEKFYTDLREHRFAAIVSGRQNLVIKKDVVFAEENNVWNSRVSPYILCYYDELLDLDTSSGRRVIYVPRTETAPGICPQGD